MVEIDGDENGEEYVSILDEYMVRVEEVELVCCLFFLDLFV